MFHRDLKSFHRGDRERHNQVKDLTLFACIRDRSESKSRCNLFQLWFDLLCDYVEKVSPVDNPINHGLGIWPLVWSL